MLNGSERTQPPIQPNGGLSGTGAGRGRGARALNRVLVATAGIAIVALLAGCSETTGTSSANRSAGASAMVADPDQSVSTSSTGSTPANSASPGIASSSGASPGSPTDSASASNTASATAAGMESNTATATAVATVGALVSGFPDRVIPLMPGATVQSSSVDQSKPLTTVSLVASSSSRSADILAYYTQVFTKQGFTTLPGNAVGSTPSKEFTRTKCQETANISMVMSGRLATVSVSASVLPAALG